MNIKYFINNNKAYLIIVFIIIILSIILIDKMIIYYSTERIKLEVVLTHVKCDYEIRYYAFNTYNDAINAYLVNLKSIRYFDSLIRPVTVNGKSYIYLSKSYNRTMLFLSREISMERGVLVAIKTKNGNNIIKVFNYFDGVIKVVIDLDTNSLTVDMGSHT